MSFYGKKTATKGKGSTKGEREETGEKVRGIRERQSQWMKERHEAKTSVKSGKSLSYRSKSGNSVKSSSTSRDLDFDISSNSNKSSSKEDVPQYSRRKPLYTAPKRDNSNIVVWSGKGDMGRARQQHESSRHTFNSKSTTSTLDGGVLHSNNDNLHIDQDYEPSKYSTGKNVSLVENIPQLSYNKIQASHLSRKPDELLETSGNGDSNGTDIHVDRSTVQERHAIGSHVIAQDLNQDAINELAETVAQRLETKIKGSKYKNLEEKEEEDNLQMSTHLCSLCRSLMSGTRHTPMALIPCGHTLCKLCLIDCKKCPTCQARVKSSAINTVLQQIITDFMAQKEKKKLEKMEKETRKYVDEYQSLSLRSDVLAEQADTILNGMEELTENLFQEKKILKRLDVKNDDLTQKIKELQNELQKNNSRIVESKEKYENIESIYEEEKQRLTLVEDTIKTIRQSKDRVKMLVRNFAPSLNLDQFE